MITKDARRGRYVELILVKASKRIERQPLIREGSADEEIN
jgi:hypothetical protein